MRWRRFGKIETLRCSETDLLVNGFVTVEKSNIFPAIFTTAPFYPALANKHFTLKSESCRYEKKKKEYSQLIIHRIHYSMSFVPHRYGTRARANADSDGNVSTASDSQICRKS